MNSWPLPIVALIAAATQPWNWGTDPEYAANAEFAPSKALCRAVIGERPPTADLPSAEERLALKGCDSEALYYGIGRDADPVQARKCAFVEMADSDGNYGSDYFAGRGTLMIIYANGVGATRNVDLAMHYACGIDGAAYELKGRVEHLARLKDHSSEARDFHICDDATSGFLGSLCAGHSARFEDAHRLAAWDRLAAGWTSAERGAFKRMREAHEAFVEASAGGEQDMSGTLRGAFYIEAEQQLQDELLRTIERLEAGNPGDGLSLVRADASLNAAYRQRLKEEGVTGAHGTVTPESIREAQRRWLGFRDAFLAFARIRYPRITGDRIAAMLTEQRTKMLTGSE